MPKVMGGNLKQIRMCQHQLWWCLVSFFCLSIWACDSKRQESSIRKIEGVEQRTQDYQKSYFFDKKVSELRRRILGWNQMLNKVIETQGNGVHQQAITNTVELMLPLLKESQRGFFKKKGNQWKKEIRHQTRLHPEKDYLLEELEIVLESGDAKAEKNPAWQLKAVGKYPKDKQGELFQIAWTGSGRTLKIQSQMYGDQLFECQFQFSKVSEELDSSQCKNLIVFRIDSKDISIDNLSFDHHKGFSGEGTIKKDKGQTEKWELRPLNTVPQAPASGSEE